MFENSIYKLYNLRKSMPKFFSNFPFHPGLTIELNEIYGYKYMFY